MMHLPLLTSLLFLVLLTQSRAESPPPGKEYPTFATDPPFHNLRWASSVVLGDYLYIDGGTILTWDGKNNSDLYIKPNNWTYSIDLTTSWTNSTVTLNPILKGPIKLNAEVLWAAPDGKSFYAFDGGVSNSLGYGWEHQLIHGPQFYQFTADGATGTWSTGSTSASSIERTLTNLEASYGAYGNGAGFALGGEESEWTSYGFNKDYATVECHSGMIVYNMTSQEWYNVSTEGFAGSKYALNGAAQFVPSFGPEGLLLLIGGQTAISADGATNPVPLDVIYMYEPLSRTWQKQAATGSPPSIVENQCVVGVQGDSGTYEIFMYGGMAELDPEKSAKLGAVGVLSLPSFHWIRQPDPLTFARYEHSCNLVGNSQMISIGGTVFYASSSGDLVANGEPDPWDQGIGILDLTELEWKSSYDPNAGSYSTPSIVKDYIERNGKYPAGGFKNGVVESWFSVDDSSTSPDIGAIVGSVVGGVAGLLIIATVVYCLVRRKRKRKARTRAAAKDASVEKTWMMVPEMDGTHARMEVPGKSRPFEAGGSQVHELDFHRVELP